MHVLVTAWMLASVVAPAATSDWEQSGRPLPRPEPTPALLDHRLPHFAPCATVPPGQRSGSVTTILPDLFNRWQTGFAVRRPDLKISSAPPFGPPQGKLSVRLQEFLDGKSDFAFVARDLTTADRDRYRQAHGGTDPLVVPVAAGSWRHFGFVDTVVVIVNAANPVRQLSFAQLDALFAARPGDGRVTVREWGQLGADAWRGKPIHIVGSATWVGEDSARSWVVRHRALQDRAWRADLASTGDEASAPDAVARDPIAIAVTGLGHLPSGVRAVAIAAAPHGSAVSPTYAAVVKGRYPLSRTVDLLLHRRYDGSVDPMLAEFVRFILSREGQASVAQQGVLLPLRDGEAASSSAVVGACRP